MGRVAQYLLSHHGVCSRCTAYLQFNVFLLIECKLALRQDPQGYLTVAICFVF